MATNTDSTTYAPGTVKGTVRVTATGLRSGMRIRLTGDRAKSSRYRSDVDGTELHGTSLILSVESELRGQKSYRAKRARWYVVTLAGGQKVSLAPASRHDVIAHGTGAPLLESLDHVETVTAVDNAIRWADATDASRAQVERYGKTLDQHDLGHLVDACWENVTDELGPEPTDHSTVQSATWWGHLALSIWSEADGEHGIDLDAAPAPAPHVVEILDEIHAEQAATEPEPAPIVDMNRERILGSLKATGSPEPVRTIAHRARVNAGIAGPILDQLVAEGLALKVGHYYRRPPAAGPAAQVATSPVEHAPEPGTGRTMVILAQDLLEGDVVVTVGPRGYVRRRSIGMVHVDHSHGVVTYEADREGPWRIPADWSLTVALPRLIPPA